MLKLNLNQGYQSKWLDPFMPAQLPPRTEEETEKLVDVCMEGYGMEGRSRDEVKTEIVRIEEDERKAHVFINETYQVNVRPAEPHPYVEFPPIVHLSIKRRDKLPIDVNHWRILQEIKNMIIGEYHEGVELYPSDKRLTDTANQYHLWVFANEGRIFPFGFFSPKTTRNAADAAACGAKQRDFDE
jgi:hypothetical protein